MYDFKINFLGDHLKTISECFDSLAELIEKEEQKFQFEKSYYECECYYTLIGLRLCEAYMGQLNQPNN